MFLNSRCEETSWATLTYFTRTHAKHLKAITLQEWQPVKEAGFFLNICEDCHHISWSALDSVDHMPYSGSGCLLRLFKQH